MLRSSRAVWALLLLFASTMAFWSGTARAQEKPQTPMPATVNICVEGASISPLRPDGSQWHYGPKVPPGVAATIRMLFDGYVATAVAGIVPSPTADKEIAGIADHVMVKELEKPLVYGGAEIAPSGVFTGAKENRRVISLPLLPIGQINPRFHHVCFDDIAWSATMVLGVSLLNLHGNSPEGIGVVKIAASTLEAVYRRGPSHVLTHDQSPSIRSVTLTVTKGR